MLGLHRHAHHWGHRKLHCLDRVGIVVLLVCQCGILLDEGVKTHHGHSVSTRHILHSILASTHAKHSALYVLDVQVLLLSRNIVRAHDPDLHSSANLSSKHSPECKEATLISSWNHLGYIKHQGSLWVTFSDGVRVHIIQGTFIKVLHTVLLGRRRGGQVEDDHFQERNMSWKPGLHDTLHQRLANEVLIIRLENNLQLIAHGPQLVVVSRHRTVDHSVDRVIAELHESTLACLCTCGLLCPFLGSGIKEVIPPQLFHHLCGIHAEFGSVHIGEYGESERPIVKPSRERNSSLIRVHLAITHKLVGVCCHDNVGVLNHTVEVLVSLFAVKHQLEEAAIKLVHRHHWANALGQRLTQHRLGLHAHSFHAINNDEGTVGDPQRCGHLGRKIHVPRGIDQVDEVIHAVLFPLESLQSILFHFIVQRNTR
mmetsp:Transcript_38624/g.74034  ORF Transcript_38624/g.74034 Transcript_38624/m.74034 type:complete len:426 (-) Transcript_38624:293-1570(-)